MSRTTEDCDHHTARVETSVSDQGERSAVRCLACGEQLGDEIQGATLNPRDFTAILRRASKGGAPRPGFEIVPSPRPEPEDEDRVLLGELRDALSRCAAALRLPGSPSLVSDVPEAVERLVKEQDQCRDS